MTVPDCRPQVVEGAAPHNGKLTEYEHVPPDHAPPTVKHFCMPFDTVNPDTSIPLTMQEGVGGEVGLMVGLVVGLVVGLIEGVFDGLAVGNLVGDIVG